MDRATVPALSYRCRECAHVFGDPEAERDFETWAMIVKVHILNAHGRSPYYLNDMLKPMWTYETPRFVEARA
jgi:hypothetical protein